MQPALVFYMCFTTVQLTSFILNTSVLYHRESSQAFRIAEGALKKKKIHKLVNVIQKHIKDFKISIEIEWTRWL